MLYKIKRLEQTGTDCGPNSLTMLLSYYDSSIKLEEVLKNTPQVKNLGTFDGWLGVTAIKLGYKVRINSLNIESIPRKWHSLKLSNILKKLKTKKTKDKALNHSIKGYSKFIELGGKLIFENINKEMLIKKLNKGPILIGLSSSYLYKEEKTVGHFVVVNGYENNKFSIIDPWHSIPFSKNGRYKLEPNKLINAILLGALTYDCCILEII